MAKNKEEMSQQALIMEYYKKNTKREIPHPEIVDWAVTEFKKRTGNVFRDPDRAIRKLAQEGQLIKINKGIYKYDPDFVHNRDLEDFTLAQREEIFKRDNYRCVVCGKGKAEGVEIQADHIKPKELGGKADVMNGQTLCAQHNFQKKYYKQTETGKRMFIRLYELAKNNKDKELIKFCEDVLHVYETNNINGHIVWKK
ncbi:MAG: HNH endonuclease signature motif containing protein [Nanoarchaeota archaeon]